MPGSESDIRRQVATYIAMGPRRGVADLVRLIEKAQPADVPLHGTIVKALCASGSPWVGEFRKRAAGRQRCAASVRPHLTRWLAEADKPQESHARLTADNVIRRARKARSQGVIEVDNEKELGWGDDHRTLLAKLHALQTQALPVDVTIHFKCGQLYVHGLALLAAWCERHAAKVQLEADSQRAGRYLDATGFRRTVEEGVTIDQVLYDGHNHVAITGILREEKATADEMAGRLVELFKRHIKGGESTSTALKIMFAELVENVYRHASSDRPAYVMAQAYPNTQKLHVVIADTGIGIFNSFRNSDDAGIRQRARTEKDAISLALTKLVTSKTRGHRGYGLYVVKELARRNGGVMRVMSGKTSWQLSGQVSRLARRSRKDWIPHQPWPGTEVTLMFNLNRTLPLVQIYKDLPPVREREDFFV